MAWGPRLYTEDANGELPGLSTDDIGQAIGIRQDGIYHVEGQPFAGTDPVGTWGPVGGNIHLDPNDPNRLSSIKSGFLGATRNVVQNISPNEAAGSEYVLDTVTRHFYHRVVNPLVPSLHIWEERSDPAGWRGFGTRSELLHRATAVGDWGYNEDNSTVEYLITFTAGTATHIEPYWTTGLTQDAARAAAIHDMTSIEDDIPEGERSKILMERGSGNAAPTAAGIAFSTDPHRWRFTPAHGHNNAGLTAGEYGTMTPLHNVTRLTQHSGLPPIYQMTLHVSANGRLPRQNNLCAYFRRHDTTGDWRTAHFSGGSDGTYTSGSHDSTGFGNLIENGVGHTLDVIFRSVSCTGNQTPSSVPSSDRIESYADGIKLGQFVIDTDLGHLDEVVRHDPRIPEPGAGDNGKVLGVLNARYALVDDQTAGAGASITDAELNVTTPGNESTTNGPSRRATAQAINTNTNAAAVRGRLNLTTPEVDDLVTGIGIAGGSITFTQNNGTTRDFSRLTEDNVEDFVAGLITDSLTVTWAYDDSAGTLLATATGGGGGATLTDATLNVDTPSSESTTEGASRQAIAEAINVNRFDLQEDVTFVALPAATDRWVFADQDVAGAPNRSATTVALQNVITSAAIVRERLNLTNAETDSLVTNVQKSGNTLTLTQNTGSTVQFIKRTEDEVEDVVAGLVEDSSSVTWTYDDSAGTLTAIATGGGGGSADGVVSGISTTFSGSDLTVELTRTEGLALLSGDVTIPNATTTTVGLVEFATNAEASGGLLTTRALVPANLGPIFGEFVSNTALSIANPVSEPSGIAASRRAVATAISQAVGAVDQFDLHEDVTVEIPVISLLDRWVVSAEGIQGDPNRYATSEMMTNYFTSASVVRGRLGLTEPETNNLVVGATVSSNTLTLTENDGGTVTFSPSGGGGGGDFDLHNDVPGSDTPIAPADRIVFSNEGSSGDPNAWASMATVYDGIREVVTANNSVPANEDRIYLTDENENGDPLEWTTIEQLGDVIGGVNVAANPTVDDDDPEVDSLTIGTTDYRVAHPHRGPYDDTRDYRIGDIVSTGSGDEEIFWIASGSIDAGQGAPTQDNIGLWWSLASHGFYRGIVDDALSYHMYPGDTWIFGDHFYLSLLERTAITGNALSTSENGVLNISEKLRVLVAQSRPPGWLDTHTSLSLDGTGITTSVENGVPTARFGIPWLQGEEDDGEIDQITTAGGDHKVLLSEPGGGSETNKLMTLANLTRELSGLGTEVFVNTLDDAGTGVTWTRDVWNDPDAYFNLGRILTTADDDRTFTVIIITDYADMEGVNRATGMTISWRFSAEAFRRMASKNPATNEDLENSLIHYFRRGSNGVPNVEQYTEAGLSVARHRAPDGNDAMFFAINDHSANDTNFVDMRIKVKLQ